MCCIVSILKASRVRDFDFKRFHAPCQSKLVKIDRNLEGSKTALCTSGRILSTVLALMFHLRRLRHTGTAKRTCPTPVYLRSSNLTMSGYVPSGSDIEERLVLCLLSPRGPPDALWGRPRIPPNQCRCICLRNTMNCPCLCSTV